MIPAASKGAEMWQEGDAAVGDLLKSPVFGPVDQMQEPVPVSNWWANRGIVLSSTELNRTTLFRLAAQCWEKGEPDWVTFLWHVLAWGVVGDYRNASKIVAGADDAEQRARLNDVLRAAAEASRRGDIRTAYTAIHGGLPVWGLPSSRNSYTSPRNGACRGRGA